MKKPKRRCPFCQCYDSALSRHIRRKHKELDEVKAALAMTRFERLAAFQNFKRRGIRLTNVGEVVKDKPTFERERAPRTIKDDTKLVMCSGCESFISSSFWSKHHSNCNGLSSKRRDAVRVGLLKSIDNGSVTEEFSSSILQSFKNDAIGNICRTDPVILNIGTRLFDKSKKKLDKLSEVKQSVRTDMRRLASLYIHFKNQVIPKNTYQNAHDMFSRTNFDALTSAVLACTSKEDGGIKAGLKLSLYYVLLASAKIMRATCLIQDKDSEASELEKFIAVLKIWKNLVFTDAEYELGKQRQIRLRRPAQFPLESDIQMIRNYTLKKMNDIGDKFTFHDSHSYIEVRNAACVRTTLLNARRGGEPARLLLSDWQEGEQDVWIDHQRLGGLDPLEALLVAQTKVCYMTGKGNNHLVPVLIPNDTLKAIRFLCDVDMRKIAGIHPQNRFVFGSTQNSENHVSGWHILKDVCNNIDVHNPSAINATRNRHRVSTLYSALEIPKNDREYFYKHMGHSAEVNENIYQAPPALMELTKVGKHLVAIDGKLHNFFLLPGISDDQLHKLHHKSDSI